MIHPSNEWSPDVRKTLESTDLTILGLETFLREARDDGASDDDTCVVTGAKKAHYEHGVFASPASVMVELRTNFIRALVRR
jgi:hypothetical protein